VRVLGVDPGSRVTGWGLVECVAGRCRLVASDVIRIGPDADLADGLALLYTRLDVVVRSIEPTSAAVESPFHGANARSALRLAHARGVVLAVLGAAAIPVAEYSPATVKKSVTGDGRAGKDQVRRMVSHLLGHVRLGSPRDLSDALAVALCHAAVAPRLEAMRRAGATPTGAGRA
jgi:crossover junction endodeoxyribonuclease RuvC